MNRYLIVALIVGTAALGTAAGASVFTGFLTSADGGIIATPVWEPVTLGWTVTDLLNGTWKYEYDLSVAGGNSQDKFISHFIVEVSDVFTEEDDILSTNWGWNPPDPDDIEVNWWTQANGNPGLPYPFMGVKFNTPKTSTGEEVPPPPSTGTHWYVQFVSPRPPVWGDFYVKDGRTGGKDGVEVTAWNEGFARTDPTAAPQNGAIDNHILRPDTTPPPPIPEACAPALASLAVPLLGARRLLRRRNR